MLFNSYGQIYNYASHDPIFPALTQILYRWKYGFENSQYAYQNNEVMPGILGCMDNASIWDPTTGKYWGYLGEASDTVETPSDIFSNGERSWLITKRNIFAKPTNSYTSGLEDTTSLSFKPTKRELVRTLLSRALWQSSICWPYLHGGFLALHTDSKVERITYPPRWDAEVRRQFRISLAQIQYSVLDTVRGYENFKPIPYRSGIPSGFEGICNLVKFNSVGWRNVSVWGFLGLLLLSGGISLGSCRNEEDKLLLVVGFEKSYKGVRWLCSRLRSPPWAMIWASVMDAKRRCVLWVRQIARLWWAMRYWARSRPDGNV